MDKELIYQIMNGEMDLTKINIPANMVIEDEFSGDRECGKLYGRVYNAELRLAEKLGNEEDEDVEEIINCMGSIARILSLKMFDYGREAENA